MGPPVFIGNLSRCCQERDVKKFFRGFGNIREVRLKDGYGFVYFDDCRDTAAAVSELNGMRICGRRVTVELAGSRYRGCYGGSRSVGGGGYIPPRCGGRRRPLRTNYRLIVENLSTGVSWRDLKNCMRQAGNVVYADAHKTVWREGVVEFGTRSAMKRALHTLDDTKLNGRRIKLTEDRSDSSCSRSQSRSRSISRSISRSKNHSRRWSSRSSSRSRSWSRCSDSRSRSRSTWSRHSRPSSRRTSRY